MNRALFLDRDGTVIEDCGYLSDANSVRLLPFAVDALARLASEGWKLIVISNQSGVGRGWIAASEMDAVQRRFLELMQSGSAPITASYFCPHAPEEHCQCRKPSSLLLERAAVEHSIDLKASYMIGDRQADILCGRNAGCSTIWLRNEQFAMPADLPNFIAGDWNEIYRILGSGPGCHRSNQSQ